MDKISKTIIPICLSTDNNYAIHCAVTMISILENISQKEKLDFYILDGGISKKNKKVILNLKKTHNFDIHFLKIKNNQIDNFFITPSSHFTKATYYRILIPSLLPKIDKIIYLDCDVIVKKNIKYLYDIDISNYYIAAVKALTSKKNITRMEMPNNSRYINSGVLLINSKKWRKENIQEKLLNFIKTAPNIKLMNVDQDAINAILYKKVKFIKPNWNTEFRTDIKIPKYYRRIINNPYIIHYLSTDKPWNINTKQDASEYNKYLNLMKQVNIQSINKLTQISTNGSNVKMRITPEYEWQFKNIKFENFSSELILERVKTKFTFLDVGAHYGYYSCLIGSKIKNTNVISIEPILKNFNILNKNLKLNSIKLNSYNFAASNKKDVLKINTAKISSRSSFYKTQHSEIEKKEDIKTIPLDRLILKNKIDFIKIDVEGHEIETLQGLKKTFINNPQLEMLIEFNPNSQIAANRKPEDLLKKLTDLNFDLYAIIDYPWQKPNKDNEDYYDIRELYKVTNRINDWKEFVNTNHHVNLLCIPKGKSKLVTFFSHSSQLGGGERSMLELIKELKDISIFSHVVLPNEGPLQKELDNINVPYDIVSLNWWATSEERNLKDSISAGSISLKNLLEYFPKLSLINPDLIYTNTIVSPWGSYAAEYLNKPHIWHIREYGDLDHGLIFDKGYSETVRFIESHSDLIITNSKSVSNHISKFLVNKKPVAIYNYISIPSNLLDQKISEPYSHKNSLKIIVCGAVQKGKNQLEAIKAVKLLNEKGVYSELLILGPISDKKYLGELKSYILKNKINKKIHFKNFTKNPYPYIQSSDIVLITSKKEALGRTAIEGMLLKKPVVATSDGGTSEIIQKDINGFLYKPGKIPELVKILSTLNNKKLRERISRCAYKKINLINNKDNYGLKIANLIKRIDETKFDVKKGSEIQENIIEELISTNKLLSNELLQLKQEKNIINEEILKIKSSKFFRLYPAYNKFKELITNNKND